VIDERVTLPTDRATWLHHIADSLLDLLFPAYCIACKQVGEWLCVRCLAEADVVVPPLCLRCGMPHGPEVAQCALPPDSPLEGLIACAFHSGVIREAIHQLKYEDLHRLAIPLGGWMAERWPRLAPPGWGADVVVPVPLHSRRERQRGYNQSALLAGVLGERLGLPVVTHVLVRTRDTRPQVGLRAEERSDNVRDAFACTANTLAGERVLLVDDVCTTGSTLTAACQALYATGVSCVWAYCLARPKPREPAASRQAAKSGRRAG
jgi:ComF family protein